ncbi:MAG: DoxX family protein [Deltaproteobacteria bacterium]|nr:DoxX family protein [Deltaproteobacteria bacterium]
MKERSKRQTIALWVLSGLLAALFLMAGGSKLAGAERHVQGFEHWGYPQWFRLVVGAAEVTSAVLLLIPRAAFFGAGALVVVMAGAIYTHLLRATGEGAMAIPPLVLLGLAALVAYARRPEALRLSGTSIATREV